VTWGASTTSTRSRARPSTACRSAARSHPEDRGALFHVVRITVAADGGISGRVLQTFGGERFKF
jgi:hypothetical protein